MLDEDAREFALFQMGNKQRSAEEVRGKLGKMFGVEQATLFDAWLEEEAERTRVIGADDRWRGPIARDISDQKAHYPGPDPSIDVAWRGTYPRLVERIGQDAADRVDAQSTDTVAHLADPRVHLVQRRGLVVGHVQSGKTANYVATIAKAVDWGYDLVVVLAGLHNTLRQQTQRRVRTDLIAPLEDPSKRMNTDWRWQTLTTADRDFAAPFAPPESFLAPNGTRTVAVVKKNIHRLRSLIHWLRSCDESVRRTTSMLVIDDEADQASVNTSLETRSRINQLVVDLLQTIPTGTYVGYTATPFANVLIDPSSPENLYPRHFVIGLPRPDGYQGAEVLFGRNETPDEDSVEGYDLIRHVPDHEAELLVPPNNKEEREGFTPTVTSSLTSALRWFVVATAARRARGHTGPNDHSSALLHTTRYVAQHFRLGRVVERELTRFSASDAQWRQIWDDESTRHTPATSAPLPGWADVEQHIGEVLAETRVVVDNGAVDSDKRLDYSQERQTVVVVGGDTLSRGLTLEGLVSSFFLRSAGAYDSLMQMGRWFGFRPGYEDLTRIWTDEYTESAFRHLAAVELELRADIERYVNHDVTPKDLAVRIRAHPAMAVTSRLKMRHATTAKVGFAGSRLQTTFFERHEREWLEHNVSAGARLVGGASRRATPIVGIKDGARGWADVPTTVVEEFLADYAVHGDHVEMQTHLILDWLQRRRENGRPVAWNVVVNGRRSPQFSPGRDAPTVDLGTVDLGGPTFNRINRTTLTTGPRADIGALMSSQDTVIDVPGIDGRGSAAELRAARPDDTALLVLYPISPDAVPQVQFEKSRHPMDASTTVLGVGLVFPEAGANEEENYVEATYVSVDLPGDDDQTDLVERLLHEDDEGDVRAQPVDVEGTE